MTPQERRLAVIDLLMGARRAAMEASQAALQLPDSPDRLLAACMSDQAAKIVTDALLLLLDGER